MSRSFVIPGPTMVYVKAGPVAVNNPLNPRVELGLAEAAIRVVPNVRHMRRHATDYGPEVPADMLTLLADATISMTLIHYDPDILEFCLWEAMGGRNPNNLRPAGTPLGGNLALFADGNHFVSLNLAPSGIDPYRFPACVLTGPALDQPLGTERSAVPLTWYAIPYRNLTLGSHGSPIPELTSDGVALYYRTLDAAPAA